MERGEKSGDPSELRMQREAHPSENALVKMP